MTWVGKAAWVTWGTRLIKVTRVTWVAMVSWVTRRLG